MLLFGHQTKKLPAASTQKHHDRLLTTTLVRSTFSRPSTVLYPTLPLSRMRSKRPPPAPPPSLKQSLFNSQICTRWPSAQSLDRSTGCSCLYILNSILGLDNQLLLATWVTTADAECRGCPPLSRRKHLLLCSSLVAVMRALKSPMRKGKEENVLSPPGSGDTK